MTKFIKVILLTLIFASCSDKESTETNLAKLETLRAENDSLKELLADLETKYVFDSISVRDIPSYQNTYKIGTEVKGEIVFVGYNTNTNSYIIKSDSIERNGSKILQVDTLENLDGGYLYNKLLTTDYNTFRADLRTENKYGRAFEVNLSKAIRASKN